VLVGQEVRAQLMAVEAVVAVAVIVQALVLVVRAVVAVLKFTLGDLYEQICTYKQSKHCR
jgi:hypothetical protein